MKLSVNFSNYRIFADRQEFSLAPVTIVFGKNNVGKSALLKLPVMLRDILNYNGEGELFERNIGGLRICEDYRDVVYKKASRAVELGITSEGVNASMSFFVEQSGKPRTRLESIEAVLYDGTSVNTPGELAPMLDFDIEYIKSIRSFPTDGYFSLDPGPAEPRTGGLFAWRRLVDDVLNHDGALLKRVSAWYQATFDGWGIETDTSRDPIFSLLLRNGALTANIVDGGAGIAQSLPVIVSAATYASRPRLNIYEEPETHLHPEAHGEMAEFIAREAVGSAGMKSFLIETHSVNFILRLRTLVASGRISPDDLALYYVEFDPSTSRSTLRRVKVLHDGNVMGWPENVFKETLEESLALRRAQLKRQEAPRS